LSVVPKQTTMVSSSSSSSSSSSLLPNKNTTTSGFIGGVDDDVDDDANDNNSNRRSRSCTARNNNNNNYGAVVVVVADSTPIDEYYSNDGNDSDCSSGGHCRQEEIRRRRRSSCSSSFASSGPVVVIFLGIAAILLALLLLPYDNVTGPFAGIVVPSASSLWTMTKHSRQQRKKKEKGDNNRLQYRGEQHHRQQRQLPIPNGGVNLASWLSLEDYFFVGRLGAVEVATPTGVPSSSTVRAAQCLPPLYNTGGSDDSNNDDGGWNSETDLFQTLIERRGLPEAIRIFHAFRVSYIDFEEDLARIAQLGIRKVRVPVSWCWTDRDPSKDRRLSQMLLNNSSGNLTEHEERTLLDRYACLDPYFAKDGQRVLWPAVPRTLVERFLQACSRHGVKAILDLHTYPGGTSIGTFSGVWPRQSLFWKYDRDHDGVAVVGDKTNNSSSEDIGRELFSDFVGWMERLSTDNSDAFNGLGGITPMNEPAHLSGLFGPGSRNPDVPSYVPPLPADTAQQYLTMLRKQDGRNSKHQVSVPDGTHLRVLKWQSDALDAFRSSSLPSKGIELVVNVHESIFVQDLVPDDVIGGGGLHRQAASLFAAWWRGITTARERSTWAVMDMHHYHAWEPSCQGTVDGMGVEGSQGYVCGDAAKTDAVLKRCTGWASTYRSAFQEQLQDGDGEASAKLVSGEFSTSTHHSVLRSCTDPTTLYKSYMAQIETAEAASVDLFYWAWKMPYGGAFRPAWSFQQFLYMMDRDPSVTVPPDFTYQLDESVISCGE